MSNHDDFDVVREAIKDLIARLDNVPAPVRKAVQDNVDTLYTLVHEHRVPRVMLIGRRGSGKSMLINAIFDAEVRMTSSVRAATGEARWEPYERDADGWRSWTPAGSRRVRNRWRPTPPPPRWSRC